MFATGSPDLAAYIGHQIGVIREAWAQPHKGLIFAWAVKIGKDRTMRYAQEQFLHQLVSAACTGDDDEDMLLLPELHPRHLIN